MLSEHPPVGTGTAIIGAGIAGMSAARVLVDHGHDVVVYEKSRGSGGRAARRRQDGFEFDHGAQYFTARGEIFRDHVDAWRRTGVVEEWTGRVVSLGAADDGSTSTRYVGTPGMSSVAGELGRGVEIHHGHRVDSIVRSTAGWMLDFEGGTKAGPFARLLLTLPAPQAAELLETVCPHLADGCRAVRMTPCWAAMLAFDQRLDVDFDAAFVEMNTPVRWMARNSSKPHRPSGETWVVHARPDWTAEHLERPQNEVAECLTAAFAELVELRLRPVRAIAHRWRYALVERALGEPCLYDGELGLGAAGDWCLGPRVECAFDSGRSAAARIIGEKPIHVDGTVFGSR